jgi:ABC-type branched-subunit amino acid transport system ATPase component/ABC-type branched-subunit amino acid transport system permease subunit
VLHGREPDVEALLLVNAGALVLGLTYGVLVGLLAVGIVLVYKTNRFLNVAHAQLGVLSVQLLGKLVLEDRWNWWIALIVCVPIGVLIGMAVDYFLVRPLRERSASTVPLLLVTLGVSLVLLVFTYVPAFGPSPALLSTAGYPEPFHSKIHVWGVPLTGVNVLTLILVPVLVAALGLFLRYSMLGKTMRAAASNADAARLCGVSPRRVSMMTWGIAGGVSAIAGILQAPDLSTFDAAALGPTLLLVGLGAAALGAFVSIPFALVGGILIGVVSQVVVAATSNNATNGELATVALIVAIVLVRGRAIGHVFSAGGALTDDRAPLRIPAVMRDRPVVRYYRPAAAAGALALAMLLPVLPGLRTAGNQFQLSEVLAYALVGVSLTVAIGWAGQVSLGQFALLGVGAFAGGHLLQHGWSLPFTVLVAGCIAAAFMLLVGLPALRVPGLTLAVTTLGLAVIAPDWLFHQSWLGTTEGTLDLSPPALARGLGRPSSYLAAYYFCLAVLVLAFAAMHSLRRSTPGRLILAVRDNESAAASFGVTPATIKLAALSLSGFLAGAAGVMWVDAWRSANSMVFTPDVSLAVLAIPVIGGMGSLGGAVAAAGVFYGFALWVNPHLHALFPAGDAGTATALLFNGLGIIFVLHKYPQGMAGAVQSWWQRQLDRMAERVDQIAPDTGTGHLVANEVSLAFGGLQVLDDTSIDVGPGEIVGLIGPNGAGKTTLLNVISGRLRADGGEVWLGNADVTDVDPEMRAGFGLGRSFQDARLFPGLTVRETVQVAAANRHKVGVLSSMVAAPWVRAAEADSRGDADAIIERLGLAPWSDALTSQLSTGTRRICDLACQLAARPKFLLLDEPTAGIAQKEAEAFGPLLRGIRDELDCAILVVEHDMPLLMGLCDRIYAMELGRVIATGTPEEIRENPAVIASYLGTDEAAIGRSRARRRSRDTATAVPATGIKKAGGSRAETRSSRVAREARAARTSRSSRPPAATDGSKGNGARRADPTVELPTVGANRERKR